MRTLPRYAFTTLLLVLFGFTVSSSFAKSNGDDPRQTIASFVQAWNTHDMEAFGSLFSDDADFVNVEGSRWRGRDEIKKAHAFVHATIFKQSKLTLLDTTFRQLGKDVVVARSTWRLEGQTTMKGDPVPPRTGIITHVLVRSGSEWKIAVTQNTDIAS